MNYRLGTGMKHQAWRRRADVNSTYLCAAARRAAAMYCVHAGDGRPAVS